MNAEQPVKLVPVTIDLELDGNNKIKDSFTWNVNGACFWTAASVVSISVHQYISIAVYQSISIS